MAAMTDEDEAGRVEIIREHDYRFRAEFGGDTAPLHLDEPPPLGGGSGPNASAALGAAVGNCLSASLLFCLERAHLEVEDLRAEVRVTPVRNAEGRRRIGSIEVVLRPALEGVGEGRFGRCLELFEDYCVVTESVRQGIDVSVRVEPEMPSGNVGG